MAYGGEKTHKLSGNSEESNSLWKSREGFRKVFELDHERWIESPPS